MTKATYDFYYFHQYVCIISLLFIIYLSHIIYYFIIVIIYMIINISLARRTLS